MHGARDRISHAGHEVRSRTSSGAEAGVGAWRGLPALARRRIAAGSIVLAVLVVVVLVLIPAAPCGAPGGDDCPAADDAIALVPADALAYAHVDIDASGEQLAAASNFSESVPLLSRLLLGSVAEVGGKPVDFASQIRPWAGDEAALAILSGGVKFDRVTMIEADDDDGARAFATGVLGEPTETTEVSGVDVTVGAGDQASALLDGFLLVGSLDGVTRMIEGTGDAGKLQTAAVAAGIDDLPDDRFAYAYLSGDGARALLRTPAAASLDTFVNSKASTAVTAALSFRGGVASVTIRSRLDSDLAESSPGFFSALPAFRPQLVSDVGADALAYLGLGDPADSVDSLLMRAQASAPALVTAFDRASEDLRREGGISINDDLLPLLGTEAALSVEPVAGDQGSETPGVLTPSGVPYVSLLADGVDSEAAAEALAGLQEPLVDAFAPTRGEAAGQVSVFEPLQIAGIEAQSLTISPNVQLTYATYEDRLVAATNPLGIAQARAGGDGLADSTDYAGVTAGMPEEVSLLAYFDLRDLISLGEQVGLATDPDYATLAPDLRSLQAAALSVNDDGDSVRTDLNISLGQAAEPPVDAAPPAGE